MCEEALLRSWRFASRACALLSHDGTIIDVSDAMAAICHTQRNELQGRKIQEICGAVFNKVHGVVERRPRNASGNFWPPIIRRVFLDLDGDKKRVAVTLSSADSLLLLECNDSFVQGLGPNTELSSALHGILGDCVETDSTIVEEAHDREKGIITLRFRTGELFAQSTLINGINFSHVILKGKGANVNKPRHPSLPQFGFIIPKLVAKFEPRITVIEQESPEQSVEGRYHILPACDEEEMMEDISPHANLRVYQLEKSYPYERVRSTTTFHPEIQLLFHPLRYIPALGKLFLSKEIVVQVSY